MKNTIIVILALAFAGLLTLNILGRKEETIMIPLNQNSPAADVAINNIMTRTSVRNYTAEPVSEETLTALVKAGMAAPTAMNTQPWKFIVITQRATLDSLAGVLPFAKMLTKAPAAIVVCGDLTKAIASAPEFWVQDCSAATQNILLAAHALGLGAVWTGAYPTDRAETVRTHLDLPENLVPLCVIALGHPAESPTPKDKWKPDNLLWVK